MKLNKRELSALEDICGLYGRSGYSKYWTPKTNIALEEKGLVRIAGEKVKITDEGRKVLREHKE